MDGRLDCWCDTCNCNITMEEILQNYHADHRFSPVDQAALQAVKEYLNRTTKVASC
ncbi:MAG: hypothetical protein JWO20_276 [Candidatus Angelobacter sp.]|jgi:hypothetical protein|nr:hypothetical protein [Candidatus Angelobacter sp.]